MIPAPIALRITGLVSMFFGAMMMCFPLKLMEGYKSDTFSGETDTTFFCFAFGILGLQMMYSTMVDMSSAKAYVNNEAVQSVNCLCNAMTWGSFILLDGRMILGYPYPGIVGKIIPKDGIVFNLGLQATLVVLNLLAWKKTGSVVPDVNSFGQAFKGASRNPLFVVMFNNVWFGLGCGIFTEKFIEMYTPGTLAGLPSAETVVPMIYWIMSNAGKLLLLNTFKTLAVCSAGGQETSFRLLRACTLTQFVYYGMFARDQMIFNASKWTNPGQVMSFLQTFGTSFYVGNALGNISGGDMKFKKEKASA